MKTFTAHFFKRPEGNEIGPQGFEIPIAASSLKAAKENAKQQAKQNDWRLLEVR